MGFLLVRKILFLRQATEAVAIETLMVNGQSGIDFCFLQTRENGKHPNKAKKPKKKSIVEEIQNHSLRKIHARKSSPPNFARAHVPANLPLHDIKDYS